MSSTAIVQLGVEDEDMFLNIAKGNLGDRFVWGLLATAHQGGSNRWERCRSRGKLWRFWPVMVRQLSRWKTKPLLDSSVALHDALSSTLILLVVFFFFFFHPLGQSF